eukprot:594795-Lingulodinium_polyedra.AAC.1
MLPHLNRCSRSNRRKKGWVVYARGLLGKAACQTQAGAAAGVPGEGESGPRGRRSGLLAPVVWPSLR